MSQFLLLLVIALVVGAIVFGAAALLTGSDPGLVDVEPEGYSAPLPGDRSLFEEDLADLRFDIAVRGYRVNQVDAALERLGHDIGYKEELIRVLESEVSALRDGRSGDADQLKAAREQAAAPAPVTPAPVEPGPAESSPADKGSAVKGTADKGPDSDKESDSAELSDPPSNVTG